MTKTDRIKSFEDMATPTIWDIASASITEIGITVETVAVEVVKWWDSPSWSPADYGCVVDSKELFYAAVRMKNHKKYGTLASLLIDRLSKGWRYCFTATNVRIYNPDTDVTIVKVYPKR